jgi:hypothetical protein
MHGSNTRNISLYNYLYLKLAKMPCFSYYLLCFFFYKIEKQEGRTGSDTRKGRIVERGDGLNNLYTCK